MGGDILIGDPMDGVEMVRELERRFAVRLDDRYTGACRTVGDLYAHLLAVLGPQGTGQVWVGPAGEGPQDTPTLMAYWRMRMALNRIYPGVEIRPDLPLDRVGPDIRRPEILRRIAEVSGLALPKARLHALWGMALAAPGVGVAWHFGTAPWIMLGVLVALLGLFFTDLIADRFLNERFARLPKTYRTVEDLARAVSLLNVGRLRQEGGRIPEPFLWASYTDCIRTVLALDGPILPEQRFVQR